jgi:hypothetical protein
VEIIGFEGEDHEFSFIKHIFKCSPKLKKMTTKLSPEVWIDKHGCTKIGQIYSKYPSVKCNVCISSGKYIFHTLD